MVSLSTGVSSLSTGLSTTNSNLSNVGSGAAAGLGGGATYDPATGTWTAPSYTVYNNNGTTSQVGSVGDVINNINTQGIKYFHSNSILPDAQATGANAVAIGPQALASGTNSVAVGNGAQATGTNAIAIGTGALATGSQAIGAQSRAGGGGVAVGDSADAGGTPLSAATAISKGTAIGFGAVVQQSGGVALGTGSVANRAGGVVVEAVSGTAVNTQAAVSVGSVGAERQITNVAGGTQATDAVNVRQLQSVQGQLQGQLQQVQAQVGVVSRIAYSGIAMAGAMAGMPQVEQGKNFQVGLGVGNYAGYSALAIGFSARVYENVIVKFGASTSSGGRTLVNAGLGYSW